MTAINNQCNRFHYIYMNASSPALTHRIKQTIHSVRRRVHVLMGSRDLTSQTINLFRHNYDVYIVLKHDN